MAYTRWSESGHYIFGGVDCVDFSGVAVPDDEVDVFIYKLFGERNDADDEFWERYNHGRRVIGNFQKGIRIQKLRQHISDDVETHAAAIAALADEVWREHLTPIIGAAQVDYMLAKFQSAEQIYADIKKGNYTYFTARDTKKGRLLGYCAIVPHEEYLSLCKLFVHSDFRNKGISRSFLDEAIALCQFECGFEKICLTVNKRNDSAIAAYQKMCFEITGSVKIDIGGGFFMDDYVMELVLPKAEQTLWKSSLRGS